MLDFGGHTRYRLDCASKIRSRAKTALRRGDIEENIGHQDVVFLPSLKRAEEGVAARIKLLACVWERFARMSAILLEGIPARLLEAHYRVNEEISARIRARRQGAKDFLVNP